MKKRLEQKKTKQSVCSVMKIQACFLGLNNIGSSGGMTHPSDPSDAATQLLLTQIHSMSKGCHAPS